LPVFSVACSPPEAPCPPPSSASPEPIATSPPAPAGGGDCALALERPLLVKGEPGTGKTLLADAIAGALSLPLLTWNVKSTTRPRTASTSTTPSSGSTTVASAGAT
jgi:hypothetical protein